MLCYEAKREELHEEKLWWRRVVWKLEGPLKTKIFLLLALAKKLITWDNGEKRNCMRPDWCIMCKDSSESMDHIFVHYSFTIFLWNDALHV